MCIHMKWVWGVLAAVLICQNVALSQATVEVVIPAKAPSRPAHFNWTFTSANGQPAQVGQFACGSYWVAPAEGDTGVTFVSLTGNPAWKDLLSCDTDPVTEKHGLLNGKNNYGSYDASQNELPKLPQTYKPAADSCISLVAAMQRDEAATSPSGVAATRGETADAYCVVTVMPKAPKDAGKNMIRPNITGTSKEILTWDDFDLARLPKHDFIEGRDAQQWSDVAQRWRHSTEILGMLAEIPTAKRGMQFSMFSEAGRAFRSALLIPNYGSGMAREYNNDLLRMFSPQNNLEEMKPAIAAMLSFGLDLYHARYNYGTTARKGWESGAGQWMGQFLPTVFVAALQKDPAKARRLQTIAVTNHAADPADLGPQELRQIKRGVTGVLLWGDGHPIVRTDNTKLLEQDWLYWSDLKRSKSYDGYPGEGNPNQGKKTAADPYGFVDGPANLPGSSYMSVAMGPARSCAALMILMPEFRRIINTDAPIEYVDRVTRHGLWAWPDPVAAPAEADRETPPPWWTAKEQKEWGKTWGPRPDDVRFAIEDGKGRFKSRHGKPLGKGGYESSTAFNHWDKIIVLYDGEKYENNLVELGVVVTPEIIFTSLDKPRAYLSCSTPGAKIHYTLDGSKPTASSPVYDGKPISVEPGTQVSAIAVAEGKKDSGIRNRTYVDTLGAK